VSQKPKKVPLPGRTAKSGKSRSLRLRLFILMMTMVLIPLIVVHLLFTMLLTGAEINSMVQTMQSQALALADELAADDYFSDPGDERLNAVIDQTAAMWSGRIQVIDQYYKIVQDTYVSDTGRYNISEQVAKCLKGESSSVVDQTSRYVTFTQPVTLKQAGQSSRIIGAVMVSVDLSSAWTPVQSVGDRVLLIEVVAVCVLFFVALIASGLIMKPFRQLAQDIGKASEGDLNQQVNVRTYHETEMISDSFNRTLRQLQRLDDSRQEFVSNVSHELKTPITSMRVLADSLMGMDNAPLELYKEFMEDISGELDREGKIIDDLLSLVRLDKKAQALNITAVNINEMLELTLKRLRPLAKRRNIEVLFESYRPVVAEIDEVKLTLAVSNLVENAIKYNKEAGWVKVSLNADFQYFYVKVADSGCGIPEAVQEHVFERFYRVDKARSRETGGTGLGLSITRSIVMLHHGMIKVFSKEGDGTTFVMRIPLNYTKEK